MSALGPEYRTVETHWNGFSGAQAYHKPGEKERTRLVDFGRLDE
jgi:hypothetical protein